MSPGNHLPETETVSPRNPDQTNQTLHHTTTITIQPENNAPSTPNRPTTSAPTTNPYRQHNYHTRTDLTSWLTIARRTTNSPPIPPAQKNNPPAQQFHQPVINPVSTSDHWGDNVNHKNHPHNLRILSRNVNTLSTADDFLDWKAATQAMTDYDVNISNGPTQSRNE